MNNSTLTYNNITAERFLSSSSQTAENFKTTIHIANFLTGVSYFYIQSLGILDSLIISSVKQRRMLEPNETPKSACNDLTVLSSDLHNILKGVSVSGITFLVNKSN